MLRRGKSNGNPRSRDSLERSATGPLASRIACPQLAGLARPGLGHPGLGLAGGISIGKAARPARHAPPRGYCFRLNPPPYTAPPRPGAPDSNRTAHSDSVCVSNTPRRSSACCLWSRRRAQEGARRGRRLTGRFQAPFIMYLESKVIFQGVFLRS